MSADDECDTSDTETIVSSNDDDDCSVESFSQDTDIDSTSDSTVSLYDTASEDKLQESLDVECAQEPIKSGEDFTLGSQNASKEFVLCEDWCRERQLNNTEKALTSFKRFIFPEWPKQTAEGNDEALEVLNLQLHHGGGFYANMKLIDLSTPANVRFDIQCVLDLLKKKMRHSTINSVEIFVLPNVKELTGGDMVKNMLGDFCGENIKIKEVVLKSDEVSSGFTAGDLEWVKGFLSHYNLDKVTIYPARSKNKEYKKLWKRLCGKKKPVDHDRTFFLKRPTTDNSNTSKRARSETTVGEDNDITGADNIINDEATEVPVLNNKSYCTTLWDHWGTDKLHEKGIDGRGVNIAFLDSGINIAHQAFKGRIIAVNDITCSGNIDLTTDRSGHGTLCASIACGTAFKSTGSKGQSVQVPAGVAPGADIVVYKITGSTGQAHTAMITKGLQQCLLDKDRYKIDIVLLSYGSDYYDNEQVKAIHALHNHGVHVVTACGNNGKLKEISYPARVGHTICIGAHDMYGCTTRNTSEGRALDFTAPGENLTGASSVHPSMFTTEGGTSFAAACVAGLLALIIQRARDIASNPRYSGIQPSVNELVHDQNVIKEVLKNISRYPEYKVSCGYGCLQPTKMLFHDHGLLELLYKDVLKICTEK